MNMSTATLAGDLISNMHHRGFTHDFSIHGEEFLWVQGNASLEPHDLEIVEYHGLLNARFSRKSVIIWGMSSKKYAIKGIMIIHPEDRTEFIRHFRETEETPGALDMLRQAFRFLDQVGS
jgi:hypothetical protein